MKKIAKKVENLEDDLSDFEEIKPDSDISRFNNVAVVQALNKTTAKTSIIDLKVGEKISYGSLKIIAHKCWQSPLEQKPENKILLEVFEVKNENSEKLQEKRIFYGWTFSSSPSISGLEHPIYDIIASNLGEEIQNIEKAGADYIHIDVMDGSFVPNITIGNEVVKALRAKTQLPFDVHLMINNPDNHVKAFAEAGADIITIHAEASIHLDRSLALIKSFDKKVGVSLVPSTHEDALDYILEKLDLILVMTVNPGFGGQKFLSSQLKKIENIRKKIEKSGKKIELEVDGGINDQTARIAIEAGADVLVSGSYIFGNKNYQQAIQNLKRT